MRAWHSAVLHWAGSSRGACRAWNAVCASARLARPCRPFAACRTGFAQVACVHTDAHTRIVNQRAAAGDFVLREAQPSWALSCWTQPLASASLMAWLQYPN